MQPRKGSSESRSARVKRELLAETNGSYITSGLSLFYSQLLSPAPSGKSIPIHGSAIRTSENPEIVIEVFVCAKNCKTR